MEQKATVVKKEDMRFIGYEGFYANEDLFGDDPFPFTEETTALFQRGLEAGAPYADTDLYEGICFDKGKVFAQVDRGDVQYIELFDTPEEYPLVLAE